MCCAKLLQVVAGFAAEFLTIPYGKHGHSTSKSDFPRNELELRVGNALL